MDAVLPNPKRHSAGRWRVYAWLCVMACFAFLPVIIRNANDMLQWVCRNETAALLVAGIAGCAGGVLPRMGQLVVEHADTLGLLGMVAAGASFGAYYTARGMARKRPRWAVIPAACVVAVICASIFVQSAYDDETVRPLVAAAEKAATGAVGAVLAANLGSRLKAGDKPRSAILGKEFALLFVIFAAPLAAGYAQCAGAGVFWSGHAILEYVDPSVVVVASASLGASYGSYKARYGDRSWFGIAVAALLAVVSMTPVLFSIDIRVCTDAITSPIAFAGILLVQQMCGALLGAHYSARLKMRGMG